MKQSILYTTYALILLALIALACPITPVPTLPIYPNATHVERQNLTSGYLSTFITKDGATEVREFYAQATRNQGIRQEFLMSGPLSQPNPTCWDNYPTPEIIGTISLANGNFNYLVYFTSDELNNRETQITLIVVNGQNLAEHHIRSSDCKPW